MAKKTGHKVVSPMGTFNGGNVKGRPMGRQDTVKTPTTPDPLGLVTTIGGKR